MEESVEFLKVVAPIEVFASSKKNIMGFFKRVIFILDRMA
jgi:hypothetical protein